MAKVRSLIRGAAIGGVASVVVLTAALLLGLASSGSRLVFLMGAVAGGVFALIPRGDARYEGAGASLVAFGAVTSGLVSGWGWLEFAGVLGSGLALTWLVAGEWTPGSHWAWFRWAGVILPLLIFILLPLVMDGGTLGHDEAAYAVKANAWLEGTPDTGWTAHRGIGMSFYGYLVLAVEGKEPGLRMIGLGGLLALAAGVWWLGRDMAGPKVGAVAAIAIVAGPSILRRSTEYLSDVPAAALLMVCMVIVWGEFGRRDLPTLRLLWLLPFAWIAFYLRYQSILSLGLIGLTVFLLWWPKVRERPAPLLITAFIGIIGLIPHFAHAVALTGTPLGILTYTGGIAERAYVGQGLVDYARQLQWDLAGLVGPLAMVAALIGLAVTWRIVSIRRQYLFLLIPASLQVIALGLLSHGEPRFVFFPLALIFVAGAIAVVTWVSDGNVRIAVPVAWALAVLLLGSLALSAGLVRRSVDNRARVNLPVEAAAIEVRSQAGASTCGVLTSYTPQITFYSECASGVFRRELEPEAAVDLLQGDEDFMVLIEGGKRQPEGADLASLIELTVGPPTLIDGARGAAVYRFAG